MILSRLIGGFSLVLLLSACAHAEDSVKSILKKSYDTDRLFIGATLNSKQLGTASEKLFLKHYTYTTPENCGKQAAVHPEPGKWKWDRIDSMISFAEKNSVVVRLHGPISPQASKWAKGDSRTVVELDKNMTEYMTAQCKRFNGKSVVKWMDVVNETVNRDGTWFGPKPGTSQWENPWLKIGLNGDGMPKYIVKAFEIATKHAPDKKLIYNQHGGMEPKMWDRVKKTILYLRKKGARVDGIGWQGHLRAGKKDPSQNAKDLKYFAELVDWAHRNKLEFHVTEIDYWVKSEKEMTSSKDTKYQAKGFANILKALLKRRKNGVVAFNSWNVQDRISKGKTYKHFCSYMFDVDGKAKPAYGAVLKVLKQQAGSK